MKRIAFIIACVIITGITFQSCKESDQKIQGEVNKVLAKDYAKIKSEVKDGVVTLTGIVESMEEKTGAENVVHSLKPVKSVVNNIEVQVPPPPVNPDDTLKSAVEAGLTVAGFKDVKVEVANGEVTLTGDIKKKDLTKVMQVANEAKPQKVNNKLNLK